MTHGCSLASSLDCIETANTTSLAALVVTEGSVSDNRPSGSGKLLDTGLKFK